MTPTPLQIDTHINYLISLIPEPSKYPRTQFDHEIRHDSATGPLLVVYRTTETSDGLPHSEAIFIAPEHAAESTRELSRFITK